MAAPLTLIDKLWAAHEITRREDGAALLFVDRHYVHEGSFHAFSQMKARGRKAAEPGLTFGVADHYVPTRGRDHEIANPEIAAMVRNLESNTSENGIKLFGLHDPRQGIVHVVGPEQGLTLPGLLIVCGDSHTSTHGAFGAYAFGIGASEVAHVLMTQTIWQKKPKRMRINVEGATAPGISGKDVALAIIARVHADGAQGHAVEFAGSAIRALSMEGRLTLCNMSIEAGGRCGMVAPDAMGLALPGVAPPDGQEHRVAGPVVSPAGGAGSAAGSVQAPDQPPGGGSSITTAAAPRPPTALAHDPEPSRPRAGSPFFRSCPLSSRSMTTARPAFRRGLLRLDPGERLDPGLDGRVGVDTPKRLAVMNGAAVHHGHEVGLTPAALAVQPHSPLPP